MNALQIIKAVKTANDVYDQFGFIELPGFGVEVTEDYIKIHKGVEIIEVNNYSDLLKEVAIILGIENAQKVVDLFHADTVGVFRLNSKVVIEKANSIIGIREDQYLSSPLTTTYKMDAFLTAVKNA